LVEAAHRRISAPSIAKVRRVDPGATLHETAERLSAALRAGAAEARAAWPGIALGDPEFVAYVTIKMAEDAPGVDPLEALGRVRVSELFLAYACALRDPAAITHFERIYFAEVDAAWRRFDALPVTLDDLRQRVREKLFLATPPDLLGYGGRGDLRGWLRATVVHMLVNIATREARERPTESVFFDAVVDLTVDAEAAYLKQACREEFEQAFIAAIEGLTAREKTLLRMAFADGFNVDQIGGAFRVHRATAARWVAKARDRLVQRTHTQLMARLEVGADDAASIVRAALSRMGTTLLRRLR
jgi:RNA polymerase sigma-70 factor (ECF subfamily)